MEEIFAGKSSSLVNVVNLLTVVSILISSIIFILSAAKNMYYKCNPLISNSVFAAVIDKNVKPQGITNLGVVKSIPKDIICVRIRLFPRCVVQRIMSVTYVAQRGAWKYDYLTSLDVEDEFVMCIAKDEMLNYSGNHCIFKDYEKNGNGYEIADNKFENMSKEMQNPIGIVKRNTLLDSVIKYINKFFKIPITYDRAQKKNSKY